MQQFRTGTFNHMMFHAVFFHHTASYLELKQINHKQLPPDIEDFVGWVSDFAAIKGGANSAATSECRTMPKYRAWVREL